ncbi:VWA domain-containing protein [Chitinimonas viridis]|uniref:VWA domain-containing protein n=1 Tax=Chitinimonas viridis TaxID=664880 RepID=A0ABT8B664_9NEIS|nr:VWA domain-containing protein [Chitinimonas viridis]MDN3577608.1 VWA domain-containing protein [Chitinimonas viridis]
MTPKHLTALLTSIWLAACSTHQPEITTTAEGSKAEKADNALQIAEAVAPPPPQQPLPAAEAPAAPAVSPLASADSVRATGLAKPQVSLSKRMPMGGNSLASPAVRQYVPAAPENRERYQALQRNGITLAAESPVSTFSIDVDTGSYSNVRRLLNGGQLPPRDAVRVEELVNYFPYDYPLPQGKAPFAVSTELAPTPWNPNSLLLRVGIQAADPAKQALPPANLVFLVDVSGSMNSADKLPLLREALKLFTRQLRPQDHVSLVTYASGTRVVLPPTSGARRGEIMAAIDSLEAGGSTAGAAGIQLAYQMAEQGFVKGGINRILLATDGDFNVGITRFETLKNLVEEKRRSGVSLSSLGFGTGNYNEQLMEQIADAGDGAYSYIDTLNEAQKVLVDEFTSTLATVASDVKIQMEFNPQTVQEYRLIGFENRALKREDFNNDKVDAGEIGAGHRVTALYEITLAGKRGAVEPLRYGINKPLLTGKDQELGYLRLRYKAAHGEDSKLLAFPVRRDAISPRPSEDLRFAAAVAAFGQRLAEGGKHLGNFDFGQIKALAAGARGEDRYGYRGEFLRLISLAETLVGQDAQAQPQIAE